LPFKILFFALKFEIFFENSQKNRRFWKNFFNLNFQIRMKILNFGHFLKNDF